MLSGTLARAPSHATAEIAKTTRPPRISGEVAALMTSEPPVACARAVATCMPCLSRSWPVAADRTAKSSNPMLVMVMRCLLSVLGASGLSATFAGLAICHHLTPDRPGSWPARLRRAERPLLGRRLVGHLVGHLVRHLVGHRVVGLPDLAKAVPGDEVEIVAAAQAALVQPVVAA